MPQNSGNFAHASEVVKMYVLYGFHYWVGEIYLPNTYKKVSWSIAPNTTGSQLF